MPEYIKNPVPEYRILHYEIGSIIEDKDFGEYSVITEVFCDADDRVVYCHRNLSDMSRLIRSSEWELDEWYRKV